MIKKIGVFIFAIVLIGACMVSADIIDNSRNHGCVKLQNVKIDDYRVIRTYSYKNCGPNDYERDCFNAETIWKAEELKVGECLLENEKLYLLNNEFNIEDITEENIDEKAIFLGESKYIGYDGVFVDFVTHDSSVGITYGDVFLYKIVKNPNYKLKLIRSGGNLPINNNIFVEFLVALILTILIETIVLLLISKFCRKSRSFKKRKLILTGILASTVTLPLLWFVFPIFLSNYWVYVIFGEILVTIIETFIIKYSLKIDRKMAIFASIICNLCSFLVGLFIF